MLSKFVQFVTVDIWRFQLKSFTSFKAFLIKILRVIFLSLYGFKQDKCQLRASALTFYTLLSVVPVAAMAFGVAKGFGMDKLLQTQILEKFQEHQEVVAKIITFAESLLQRTKGGLLAGIGIFVLFWTVIKLLGNIENAFNNIWGVKKSRSFIRKFSEYLSLMFVCPVLLIVSSSVTVLLANFLEVIISKVYFLQNLSFIMIPLLKLMPYGVVWLLFTFIYIFMPNTKVSFKSGLIGGVIAGTIYQIVQWGYITFQVGVSKYGAIYGSFAALPFFLVWLQLSWIIVLLGAEVSFAYQNVDTYEFEPDCKNISYSFKKLITVAIMHLIVKNFYKAQDALTAEDVSRVLEVPVRLVRQILFELGECYLIAEVKEDDKMVGYQPARDVSELTINDVINKLETHGSDNIPFVKSKDTIKLSKSLELLNKILQGSKENFVLKEI